MTLLQALLIALFGYLSSNYSPWCFGQLGGWYTMGRPLVSGLIIGVILGDVRTGILMALPSRLCISAWLHRDCRCRRI